MVILLQRRVGGLTQVNRQDDHCTSTGLTTTAQIAPVS